MNSARGTATSAELQPALERALASGLPASVNVSIGRNAAGYPACKPVTA